MRVTTLNAGAGLESPIVFLVGLKELFEMEQSLRLSDSEREALVRDNTRKLNRSATRAGQRLVTTYVGELPATNRPRIHECWHTVRVFGQHSWKVSYSTQPQSSLNVP